MVCVVCDRCKRPLANSRSARMLTCAWPYRTGVQRKTESYRGDDRQQNDILWEKELCVDCLDALEAFMENGENSTENSSNSSDSKEGDSLEGSDYPS